MIRALLAAALLAFALAASPATAAPPRASLPDIEDEVMCLECGTALNVSTSDVADQERDFIAGLIAQGRTKAEIKAALVNEYGPRVLAEPQDDGFQLTAWIVPVLAGLSALALLVLVARRWRGRGRAEDAAAVATAAGDDGLAPGDSRRLDDELAAFDR